MTDIGINVTAISGIPDLHGFIAASGGDAPAIGRPRHTIDKTAVASIEKQLTAIRRVPDLHGLIIAGRGDTLAIGRPRYGPH